MVPFGLHRPARRELELNRRGGAGASHQVVVDVPIDDSGSEGGRRFPHRRFRTTGPGFAGANNRAYRRFRVRGWSSMSLSTIPSPRVDSGRLALGSQARTTGPIDDSGSDQTSVGMETDAHPTGAVRRWLSNPPTRWSSMSQPQRRLRDWPRVRSGEQQGPSTILRPKGGRRFPHRRFRVPKGGRRFPHRRFCVRKVVVDFHIDDSGYAISRSRRSGPLRPTPRIERSAE